MRLKRSSLTLEGCGEGAFKVGQHKKIGLTVFLGIFILLFFLALQIAISEDNFQSCKFRTEEEAKTIAIREFMWLRNLSGAEVQSQFEITVLRVGPAPTGGYSANIDFKSLADPWAVYEMWLMDDCTQSTTQKLGPE